MLAASWSSPPMESQSRRVADQLSGETVAGKGWSRDEAFQHGRNRNHLQAELQRRWQGTKGRVRGFACITGFSHRREWIDQEMTRIRGAAKWSRRERPMEQNASCKGSNTAINDGRQKPARQLGSRREDHRPLQHEKERGDRREMWKEDEAGNGKTASGAGLYISRKQRVGRCLPPCPKGPGQT